MTKNKNKKHIDVVVKYFYPIAAGIETNILETYSVLVDLGWNVVVHTSKDTYLEKNSLDEEFEIRGIKVKRYGWSIFGFWPKINWLKTDALCLHNFNIFPHFQIIFFSLFLKAVKRKKFALIITPHGGFNPEWRIFSWPSQIIKKFYHFIFSVPFLNYVVDGMRAVSEWERGEMIKKGIKAKKVLTIDNGLEDEAYADLDEKVSSDFKKKIDAYGNYILQIGRVYMIKNYETTLRALSLLDNDLKFVITGPVADLAYKKKLDEIIKDLNLEGRVIFSGVIRSYEKYYLIKKAEMMVHMALWESYCNVVHEGMSQGLVCVVANNTALPYLIKDKVNGFTVSTQNHEDLAGKIKYVYNNRNSSAIINIKERNRKIGLENSWKKVAQKMDIFYRDLLKI